MIYKTLKKTTFLWLIIHLISVSVSATLTAVWYNPSTWGKSKPLTNDNHEGWRQKVSRRLKAMKNAPAELTIRLERTKNALFIAKQAKKSGEDIPTALENNGYEVTLIDAANIKVLLEKAMPYTTRMSRIQAKTKQGAYHGNKKVKKGVKGIDGKVAQANQLASSAHTAAHGATKGIKNTAGNLKATAQSATAGLKPR